MRCDIFVMDGCHYCEQLMAKLDAANIPYKAYYTEDNGCGFKSTPGTYLDGNCYGYPSCDVDCQFNHIQEAYSKSTTPTPSNVSPAPASKTTTPDASAVYSNEITIKWGGIQTGYAGKRYSDATDEAVTPIPPEQPVGMTIALREKSKVIKKEG